jgi:glutathione S-transferase
MELILGNKNYSSWSLRPWLALRQANIPFTEKTLLFETPGWRETIRQYSPTGKVPALRHGDIVVVDSLAICEYVAELFPDKRLWPEDRVLRAQARSVACEMHSGFMSLRRDLWMNVTGRTPKKQLSAETQAEVDRVLAIWNGVEPSAPRGKGDFLFGHFSIADAMFAPVVFRFRTYDIPVTGDRARAWYERMLSLPAMQEWEAGAKAEPPPKESAPGSAQQTYAVIFSSQHSRNPDDLKGYDATAEAMEELAKKQPGFLGIESARGADGFGITVSYWDSLEAIAAWKSHEKHRAAQERGKSHFYERYSLRVCSVERTYGKP